MKAKSLEEILKAAEEKIHVAEHDFKAAVNDCKNGIYDKWFRYHRSDDGRAYDLGWMYQNKEIQNETVQFI